MQQAQADPQQLINRAGGKNVTTQLSKGDPEIVQEVVTHGEAKQIPIMAYADAQTKALFYQALFDILKESKPNPQIVVLHNTGKIFLDPKYKPQLMSAQIGVMSSTMTAMNVDLKAYRAELVHLKEDYVKKGMKVQQDCIDTLLTALNKQQLLTVAQLQQVYDEIGKDVALTQGNMKQTLNLMVKNGNLTPIDMMDMEKKMQGNEHLKMADMLKAAPEMTVEQTGKVISKRKGEKSKGQWPDLPPRPMPTTNKFLAGQACGPARAPQQMYSLPTEYSMSVELEEEVPAKVAKSILKK